MNNLEKSKSLFERAVQRLPGGVNSPVRAFKAVGGIPPFVVSGRGAYITDADGNKYLDYVSSYGPLLFGHGPEFLTEVISKVAASGTVFGAPTEQEVEIAELVSQMVPSIEMVRFVNSGSEAVTSAIRLARGATGRTKVVKCAGCFHGSVDSMLVAAGSGVATLGIPETAGVPASTAAETIVVEYNDSAGLQKVFDAFGGEIAAFILEPVAGNMGLVLPDVTFLQKARELTRVSGALLIFDEVISGFRMASGGAQQLYGIQPDLTCLGKIVGGGIPCGAYGGSRNLMENLAPVGKVYQAGTLSGNPLAMSCGLAMLREIERRGPALYESLNTLARALADGLASIFLKANVPVQVNQLGSLVTPFFCAKPVRNYPDAKCADTAAFARFFHGLLTNGVYVPPSQYECWFLSAAHTHDDIGKTLEAVEKVVRVSK
jgi:glutamate-1-semialdehyde 2,1-aminomutase